MFDGHFNAARRIYGECPWLQTGSDFRRFQGEIIPVCCFPNRRNFSQQNCPKLPFKFILFNSLNRQSVIISIRCSPDNNILVALTRSFSEQSLTSSGLFIGGVRERGERLKLQPSMTYTHNLNTSTTQTRTSPLTLRHSVPLSVALCPAFPSLEITSKRAMGLEERWSWIQLRWSSWEGPTGGADTPPPVTLSP